MDDAPKAEAHLIDAIRLAMENVRRRTNAPFGAVITREGKIIARAANQVDDLCDPTAHAEMQAVRAAAERGYVEIARPPDQREMKLQGLRARDDGEDLYEAWKKINPTPP